MTGRYAPSPSGDLHIGNLRTALLAWLFARSSGRRFLLRIEDLDAERCSPQAAQRQLSDLRATGIGWDGDPIRQSERDEAYRDALGRLVDAGVTYECFCTRREIRQAQSAPHHDGTARYPGTCRNLSPAERAERAARGRPPSIRLRGGDRTRGWHDLVHGEQRALTDDVVLCRWDGAIAYNLAVVVDDIWQGVDQVVRGDDLLDATPTQLLLLELLGAPPPAYAHVPLVVNTDGARLAKRDGAVTLADLSAAGVRPEHVVELIAQSLRPAVADDARTAVRMLETFDATRLPLEPWTFDSGVLIG